MDFIVENKKESEKDMTIAKITDLAHTIQDREKELKKFRDEVMELLRLLQLELEINKMEDKDKKRAKEISKDTSLKIIQDQIQEWDNEVDAIDIQIIEITNNKRKAIKQSQIWRWAKYYKNPSVK